MDFGSLLFEPLLRAVQSVVQPSHCHLVGGALRDRYLGRAVADFDVVVSGDGRRIAKRLAEETKARLVTLGSDRFASFRLIVGDHTLDLWDRGVMSLEEDLARRDFTINSLALNLNTGELLDPCGGLEDLARHQLRSTSEISFSEDALRVLRLVRFSLELGGFSIDRHTLEAARENAGSLTGTARERIREELDAILRVRDLARAVRLLAALRLFPGLWLGAPGKPYELGNTPARLDLLRDWIDELEGILASLPDRPDHRVCVHATLLDCAVAVGRVPPQTRRSLLRSEGLVTTRLARQVYRSLLFAAPPEMGVEERLFLAAQGPRWVDSLGFWGSKSLTHQEKSELRASAHRLTALVESNPEILNPRPLLNGHEVKKLLDLPPGPPVGRALEELLAAQVSGQVTNRAEAESFLRARRSLYRATVCRSPTTSCR